MHAATHDLFADGWGSARGPLPAEPAPVERTLPAADERWRSAWHTLLDRLRPLLHRHRLEPQRARRWTAHTTVSPALRAAWQALAAGGDAGGGGALVHAQAVVRRLHERLLGEVGVDGRQVLHLHHRSWHPRGADADAAVQAAAQSLQCRLLRTARVGHAAVLLVFETTLCDAAGDVVAVLEDGYVARRLAVADVVRADDDATLRRAVGRLRRRGPELRAADPGTVVTAWPVDAAACRAFAAVAGGLATGRRPFVQAAHLRHLAVCRLGRDGPVARLTMTFVGRARAGQVLRCLQSGERFEIVDDAGRLVAFGSR